MTRECPKTCNRCFGEIIDVDESCGMQAMHCSDPASMDLMAWQCPRTCGYDEFTRPRPSGRVASAPTPQGGCVDHEKWDLFTYIYLYLLIFTYIYLYLLIFTYIYLYLLIF